MTEEMLSYKKRGIRLKLLRTVGFYKKEPNPLEHPFFPPLALGILFTQLKNSGYDVSQDDLSIRAHNDIFAKGTNKQFRHELFFQEERIKLYVKSGTDDELEREIEKVLEAVNTEDIDIFLLSIPESPFNSSNLLFTIAFSKFLKKKYSPQIVVGGDIISVELLKTKYDVTGIIDYIVVGPGEEAVIDVVEKIIYNKGNGDSHEPVVVEGWGSKKIIIPDFTGLPWGKYRLSFLDYKDFSSNEILRDFFASDTSMMLFQFAKGCPNACAFCGSSSGSLGAVLMAEEVVNAIDVLQESFKPTGYLFMNDTINISQVYIERICEMICKKDMHILWSACARVNGLDEEVIAKMRESGCIRLILGMETASSSLLKRVNKGITIPELENVLKLTHKYGIWTGVEVICGLPHETDEDIDMTIEFLLNNKECINIVYRNVFDLRDDSLMILRPEDYGIENIREINLYRQEGTDNFNKTNFIRYSFDETNGLKWKDKKRQMIDSFNKVERAVNSPPSLPEFLEEHILFYLYSRFSDKNIIKKYYLEFIECF